MPGGADFLDMNETGGTDTGDLALVGLAAVLSVPVVLFSGAANPVRVLFGLALVLFLPGYALVSAVFPRRGDGDRSDRPTGLERLVLGVGLSLAVTVLTGVVLSLSGVGFRTVTILSVAAGVTLVSTAVAWWRRRQLPANRRFRLPVGRWRAALRANTADAGLVDSALTALAVLGVVVLLVSLVFAAPLSGALGQESGEEPAFTEAFLLTPGDGQPVADAYPTALSPSELATLTVGLGNNENTRQRYTVLVYAERVVDGAVAERQQLHRFEPTIDDGTRWRRDHVVRPVFPSDRVRLQYLVYRGDPPAEPGVESAYRELHLWIDVRN